MLAADLAIVGAGPAGAALAAVLAPKYRVLLVDRRAAPGPRIGESLIPAARRLLRDMRLLDAFDHDRHAPYLGNRSFWGGQAAQVTDFIRDPDGPGWHLDRPRFESFLRRAATQRRAMLLAPAKLTDLKPARHGWHLGVQTAAGARQATARLIVDAGGRSAPVAKRLGAHRKNTDTLVAHWLHGTDTAQDPADAGFSTVESDTAGWWYTAPVLHRQNTRARVLAFHSDSDLCASRPADAQDLIARARSLPGLGPLLDRAAFTPASPLQTTAANSAHLAPCTGPGWLAIGDAALSFDPLASRGIFNALYTAMSAAMACDDALHGGTDGFTDYAADLHRVRAAYRAHLATVYSAETRWPDAPFWQRRLQARTTPSPAPAAPPAR